MNEPNFRHNSPFSPWFLSTHFHIRSVSLSDRPIQKLLQTAATSQTKKKIACSTQRDFLNLLQVIIFTFSKRSIRPRGNSGESPYWDNIWLISCMKHSLEKPNKGLDTISSLHTVYDAYYNYDWQYLPKECSEPRASSVFIWYFLNIANEEYLINFTSTSLATHKIGQLLNFNTNSTLVCVSEEQTKVTEC